jgi:hypothetical protein
MAVNADIVSTKTSLASPHRPECLLELRPAIWEFSLALAESRVAERGQCSLA